MHCRLLLSLPVSCLGRLALHLSASECFYARSVAPPPPCGEYAQRVRSGGSLSSPVRTCARCLNPCLSGAARQLTRLAQSSTRAACIENSQPSRQPLCVASAALGAEQSQHGLHACRRVKGLGRGPAWEWPDWQDRATQGRHRPNNRRHSQQGWPHEMMHVRWPMAHGHDLQKCACMYEVQHAV